MQVLSMSEARATLKQTMDDVCRDHEPAVITRQRGEPVVMLSLEDYNSMKETLHLVTSPENARRLRESVAQFRAGLTTKKEVFIYEQQEEAKE